MSRPADWQQRELACDLQHSYIVQAPAGSGKTELLTQRLLALLAGVENPEEVIAITFTRKAAAEMSFRLVSHLQDAARQKMGLNENENLQPHEQISRELALAVLENDARQGWNLLEQPSRLRIRTIDSLCSELARQLPVLSGLGGGQQITEDANALYRKAAARTMAVIEEHNDELKTDVIRVLDRYDNQYDKLVDLLTGMLASREQWMNHLLDSRSGDGFDRQGMEEALRYLVEAQLETARQLTPENLLGDLPRFYHYAIGNDANNADALKALLEVCGGPDCDFLDLPTSAEALPHWQTMISGLLTAAGDFRKAAPTAAAGFPAPSSARGEDRERFHSAAEVQRYSGIAPVTERSGNTSWVHWRWACSNFVRQTFVEWAEKTVYHSFWAGAYYRQQRSKGANHHTAVRALAFKWIRILYRCWKSRTPYNESLYLKALQRRGSSLLPQASP